MRWLVAALSRLGPVPDVVPCVHVHPPCPPGLGPSCLKSCHLPPCPTPWLGCPPTKRSSFPTGSSRTPLRTWISYFSQPPYPTLRVHSPLFIRVCLELRLFINVQMLVVPCCAQCVCRIGRAVLCCAVFLVHSHGVAGSHITIHGMGWCPLVSYKHVVTCPVHDLSCV
jgi:hypothetical protein